jgi:hypothetical protein
MAYRITGLSPDLFEGLSALDDEALQARGIRRVVADANPGYPCRISLQDAAVGEALLLLWHEHHAVDTPYRGGGPIFIREAATEAFVQRDAVPQQQTSRLLSVRAYDAQGWMLDADVIEGTDLEALIARCFANPQVDYLHVHNARRGCYACRVDRD